MQHQATTSSLLGKALQVIQLPKRNQTKNANRGKQAQMVSNSLGFGNPFQNILLRKKKRFHRVASSNFHLFPCKFTTWAASKTCLPIHSLFKTTIFLCEIWIWLRQLATPQFQWICLYHPHIFNDFMAFFTGYTEISDTPIGNTQTAKTSCSAAVMAIISHVMSLVTPVVECIILFINHL